MVFKTELCVLVAPRYTRARVSDSSERTLRKQHKKDIHAEAAKKRHWATKKPYSRSIVGATLEVIQKKKPEVRDDAREATLREIKERIKKTRDEKKAQKAKNREEI